MVTSNFKVLAVTGAIASLFLAGCGGGGGSSAPIVTPALLSGTVAGGAAVIGTVIVTDSKGATKSGNIEANGHYSIDVNGMTGPFVLKAAGTVGNTSVTYYSAATVADVGGTVNVTPFTNLIVSNIAAQMAENYFKDGAHSDQIGSLITPANLVAAETALQAKLQPVLTALGVGDSIDLLRTTFAADHSGMDAVLDLVKVEVDTTTNIATLKNAMTLAVMATDNAADKNDTTPVSNTTGITPTAATDLQAVVAKLNGFAALFATGLPTRAAMEASGVFDISSNFMMGGQTFAQFADELSTQSKAVGLKFSNVAIELDAAGTSGMLTADISSNSADFGEKIQLKMVKVNNVWQVQGDGMIANVSIYAQASRNEWITLPSAMQPSGSNGQSMQSGINIWIDPFAYNSTPGHTAVVSALVTGPGLGNGITMVQDVKNTWLKLSNSMYSDNLVPECAATVTTQCVNIAQAVDNSEYTIVLKDGSGNALNGTGYKLHLPKQPYATSALTAAMFPSIASITIDGSPLTPSTVIANKSVAIGWTMPTGLQSKDINVWANTTTGDTYVRVEKSLSPTATSALIGLGSPMATGTVSSAGVWLQGIDAFGRRFGLSKSVQSQ
ncbi:hypothetical protein Rfer_3418 [Rhodoferax ferrireducens T118]|uniref:Carboxypeptidase regulatory-like domain-containing protein n=1 Tax=Albidiferax ferrireducens (strain ATCC BAA-621 / DSM 15236 / T118) TaxID=338969 RepID=Q21SX6_ALBFT|nr:hypothetical protein [Rhodoferax ferrireducens]ABD71127.1 hypothetical protein Rfer_3418 [Rhodoferax ferrireducens T118]